MLEFFSKRKGQKGFTLIELLVVIAIIGILATIVLVSLNTARQKARDARRLSDLRQIALALEMYYDDHPNTGYIDAGGACIVINEANLGDLTPDYIGSLPEDPGTTDYYYGAASDEQDYVLRAILEGALPAGSYQSDIYSCSCDQSNEYCIRP